MDTISRLSAALVERYAVERELGRGGMATVWLATDTRHRRKVALKVLHPELTAVLGPERFLQEIEITASFQHPHILPLFDSEDADGQLYYVMPYVDGETLRARLDRETQLPLDEAVRTACEIADALAYAHARGIVHRDVKPENVLLHGAHALVADFGIALAVQQAGGGRLTQTGLSLGTPQYMSPEQAMGERTLDARSDVYALGAVLYEMLVGEPPFTGATTQAIVAKVMAERPVPPRTVRDTVPPHLEAAILRALAKVPADRFASAPAFAAALTAPAPAAPAPRPPDAAPVAAPRASRRRTAALVLGALAAGGAAGAAVSGALPGSTEPAPATVRFAFRSAGGVRLLPRTMAISPDGSTLLVEGADASGEVRFYLRRLDDENFVPLAGTEYGGVPFFSPDGRSVGFVTGGNLRRIRTVGGAPRTIVDAGQLDIGAVSTGSGAAWGADDRIAITAIRGLLRVSADGGRPALVARTDSAKGEVRFVGAPSFLDTDDAVVVCIEMAKGDPQLAVVSLADGAVHRLGIAGRAPAFVPPDRLTYVDAYGRLLAAPFDPRRRAVTGDGVLLAERVRTEVQPTRANVVVSRAGTLAYFEPGAPVVGELVVTDRSGDVRTLPIAAGSWRQPRYSPDGRRLAFATQLHNIRGDVWVYDFPTRRLTRLTHDSLGVHPVWSPDGRWLVYPATPPQTVGAFFRVRADGGAPPERLLTWRQPILEVEPTADGRSYVFRHDSYRTLHDIYVVPADTPSAPRPLLATMFADWGIAVAPRGDWLAYVSNASGRDEVYVRRLADGSPTWTVSVAGGHAPRWSRDGRELFFVNGDSLFVSAVQLGDEPRLGAPRALFAVRFASVRQHALYDVSPDGREFAMVRRRDGADAAVHVVVTPFGGPRRGARER
jgi:serine/threonine-protein kinase